MRKHLFILAALLFFGLANLQAQDKMYENKPECKIHTPNAFTPNDDGVNDFFNLSFSENCESLEYDFKIFDRWGRLVFESDEVTEGWDGTYDGQQLKEGVYLWQVSVVWENDVNAKQPVTKKGTLVLIR